MSEQEKGNLKIENNNTNYPMLMQQLDGGVTGDVIGAMLTKLGLAVKNTDRAGKLTITIDVKPGNSADNSFLNFNTGLKISEPKLSKGSKVEDSYYGSIVFVGRGGKLTYDRPKEDVNGQNSLALGSVESVQLTEDRKVRKL
ncbi:hypothetical protein NVP1232O_49 [Vibrio phage 1.232.O._10N.261.51.E11]|nr:hypothetical protein NVP1232O_49 [Vibrio phage 1.232.O._10N.261.51.E11]